MNKLKRRNMDRIVAFILIVVIVSGFAPADITAKSIRGVTESNQEYGTESGTDETTEDGVMEEPSEEPIEELTEEPIEEPTEDEPKELITLTFNVINKEEEQINNASIKLEYRDLESDWAQHGDIVTTNNGIAVIEDLNPEYEYRYTVSCYGYVQKENVYIGKYTQSDDVVLKLEKKEYEVTFAARLESEESIKDAGSIKLDGDDLVFKKSYYEDCTKNFQEGSEVNLQVTPNKGYRIAEIEIEYFSEYDTEYCSETTEDGKDICIKSDMRITIEFKKVDTITVTYNEDGTVEFESKSNNNEEVKSGEVIVVNKDLSPKIIAIPNDGYRVSEVKLKNLNNNNERLLLDDTDDTYDEGKPYEIELANVVNAESKNNYEIAITFSPKVYSIKINTEGEGSIKVRNGNEIIENFTEFKVNHGDTPEIFIIQEEGYHISKFTVQEEDKRGLLIENDANVNEYKYILDGITENKDVYVEFRRNKVITDLDNYIENDYYKMTFTKVVDGETQVLEESDILREYTDDLYTVLVLPQNAEIKIEPQEEYDNIKLNMEEKSYELIKKSDDLIIDKITVYKNEPINVEGEDQNKEILVNYKIVYDSHAPQIDIRDEAPNNGRVYNDNFNVIVNVEDSDYSAGLESVDYKVVKDGDKTNPTQEGTLYSYNSETGDIETSINETINIIAEANNSDNVVLYVKAKDRAGRETEIKKTYKINTIPPKVSLSINGSKHPNAKKDGPYYNKQRTATITIVDACYTFDKEAANNAIKIYKSNEADAEVQEILDEEKGKMISEWSYTKNEEKDVYTAQVVFSEDAKYKWSFGEYINKADLSNDGYANDSEDLNLFTIDKEPPKGNVFIEDKPIWEKMKDKIIEILTFGIWTNDEVQVRAEGEDNLLPFGIEYYKHEIKSDKKLLNIEQLEEYFEEGKFSTEEIKVNQVENFVVYARITDYAGNTTYVSSEGIGIDKTKSEITLTPESPNEHDIYNGDFKVNIEVNDKVDENEECSGIKEINYKIVVDDDIDKPTQEGTLYSKKGETYNDVIDFWEGTITVDAELNNSDKVEVTVTAIDNAGNKSDKLIDVSINTDKPIISLKFDNNEPNKILGDKGYYNDSRVATISVKDRKSAFDGESVKAGINIDAVDSSGNPIDIDINDMISDWTHSSNEKIEDIHTAEIIFDIDANYTLKGIDYTNNAGNAMDEVQFYGQTPVNFVIDKNAPTGSILVSHPSQDDSAIKAIFNELVNKLTFSSYSNDKILVSAIAQDDISSVIVEYYKTDNPKAMSKEALDEIALNQKFIRIFDDKIGTDEEFEIMSVEPNEQFVIYLKISDYAGNYTYVSTDGYILDDVASDISLTFDKANKNGIYNKDVNVNIEVTEKTPYSGIKTVDYKVVKDGDEENPTQKGNLFTYDIDKPSQDQLIESFKENITINAEKNNSSNVVLYVKTEDNAGNVSIVESEPIDIDVTAPSIDITYNNNNDNNGNSYFDAKRTATVTITERPNHFNKNDATNGIRITAKDLKGNNINDSYTISDWKTVINKSNTDKSTHTATINFNKDANYNLSIGYTDMAGNVNSKVKTNNSVAPYKFTVDTTAPTGVIKAVSAEGRTEEWDRLSNSLRYGFWSNKKISISATSSDITSPIAKVEYYKDVSKNAKDKTKALTVKELNKIKTWSNFKDMEVSSDEQFVVYLKITDKAGNYTYISTNGLIVDKTRPVTESIAPEITIRPQQPINGIYKGDVRVSIEVVDPMKGGTYSGLKEVSYEVYNKAVSSTNPTQSGTLFTFNNKNPKQSDLVNTYNGSILVDSSLNNSNDIEIVVTAVDNSLNSSDKSNTIKVDTTAPRINISYDNNNPENNTFFKDNRTATILVTERNFNPDDVNINITNLNGATPTVSAWRKSGGSGNLDNTRWTANITYSADGDYTFDIGYTDLAGNVCRQIDYSPATVAGEEFTIDKTTPLIDVSYDNNSPQNTNYYKEGRMATITITEHNFSADRVEIDLTASDDGRQSSLPRVSGWLSNGDKHTATIDYFDDSLYSFDIRFTDQAGNAAETFQKQTFYIDKTKPSLEITGVNNNSANSGQVIPVITCSDTNFDESQLKITLVGANRNEVAVEGDYSNIHNGKIFTFKDFDNRKEIDDIYTLTATLTDKAGNSITETIDFSINRFGSNYVLEDSAKRLNGTYMMNPEDFIISEINANKLKDIIITLYKNDQTIILTEDKDYKIDIKGGDGSWYKYTYTIFKENFKDDGIYRIEIESKDQAGNTAVNTLDTKDMHISFAVDSTPPNIIVANLSDNETYAVDNLFVSLSANDNLKLASLEVYLNGNEHARWSGEELEKVINKGGNFEFEISGDSTKAHTIKIVATDQAGHEATKEIKNFYVTTNLWVRFVTNKNLVYGVFASGTLSIAFIILLVVWRKKKRNV